MESSVTERVRPGAAVRTVEVIAYLGAALNLLAGVVLLVIGEASESGPDKNLADFEIFLGIALIVWGVLLGLLARGLGRGSETARILWVVLNGIQLLSATATLIQGYIGAGLVSLVIPSLLIYLVYTPSAERYFRQESGASAGGGATGGPPVPRA